MSFSLPILLERTLLQGFSFNCRGLGDRKFVVAERGWRAELATRRRDAVVLRDADVGQLPVGTWGRRRRRRQHWREQRHRALPLPILRPYVSSAQLPEEARTGICDSSFCFLLLRLSSASSNRYRHGSDASWDLNTSVKRLHRIWKIFKLSNKREIERSQIIWASGKTILNKVLLEVVPNANV